MICANFCNKKDWFQTSIHICSPIEVIRFSWGQIRDIWTNKSNRLSLIIWHLPFGFDVLVNRNEKNSMENIYRPHYGIIHTPHDHLPIVLSVLFQMMGQVVVTCGLEGHGFESSHHQSNSPFGNSLLVAASFLKDNL